MAQGVAVPGAGTEKHEHSAPGKNYLNAESGIWSWLTTVDHKRIGIMYLVSVLIAFSLGGFFALSSVEARAAFHAANAISPS